MSILGRCMLLVLLLFKTTDCNSQGNEPVDYFGTLMPYCKSRFCEKRCLNEKTTPTIQDNDATNCFCDSVCIIYGDCCPDYYTVCLDQTSSPTPVLPGNYEWVAKRIKTMSRNTSKFKLSMILFKHKMCSNVYMYLGPEYLWSIAECPHSYDASISFKCHNPKADVAGYIPATHKMHKFINFKNIFCAICHGVSVSDLRVWNTTLKCIKEINKTDISFDTLPDFLRNGDCSLLVQPPDTTEVRYCHFSDVIDHVFSKRNSKEFVRYLQMKTLNTTLISKLVQLKTDNQTSSLRSDSETLLELCGSYRYMVALACQNINRNIHCNQLEHGTVSVDKYLCQPCSGFSMQTPHVSLGVLFSFDVLDRVLCSSPSTCWALDDVTCQVNEVYDYYLDRCQQLVCPIGKYPVNGSCVINGTVVHDLQYQIFPDGFHVIHLDIGYNQGNCTLRESQLLEVLRSSFEDTSNKNYSGKIISTEFINATKPISINFPKRKVVVVSSCLHDDSKPTNSTSYNFSYSAEFLNVLVKVLKDSYYQDNILEMTISTFPSNEVTNCENNSHMANQNGVLLESNKTLFVYHNTLYYPLENVPFVIKVGVNNSGASLVEYAICEKDTRLLDCPMISYPENMTESQNTSLHILGTEMYFPLGSFVFEDNRVYVCSNFSRSYAGNRTVTFFNFNSIQGTLTLVCSLVSVISLALTLAVYLALPDLRNVPGKIVMSVSFSLMTSQSLLLLSNVAKGILCKLLGIFLHWTWLSTFVWMTIMATNLVKTFTGNSTARHNQKVFSFYAVIALIVPAVFVASCAAMDMARIPKLVIGYGDNDVCWISNPKAILMVFGVPLAVLLLINVVCFVITICAIQRSMDISKTATSTRKDRVKCIIYCKLLIITGLTWGFGFAAAFSKSEELWYVFIVLNGSQGIYILFCFVVNLRVLRLLKIQLFKTKHLEGLNNESRSLSTQV